MEKKNISFTRYKVLLKKINNLVKFSNENNFRIPTRILDLIIFIKEHKNTEINMTKARELEDYTGLYETVSHIEATRIEYFNVIAKSNELIRYSEYLGFKLCSYFLEDLEHIQNSYDFNDGHQYTCENIRNYIRRVWRVEECFEKIGENTFYILKRGRNSRSKYKELNKDLSNYNLELTRKKKIIFDKISKTEFNADLIIKEMLNRTLNYHQDEIYEVINRVLYDNFKESGIKTILYAGKHKDIRNYIIQSIKTKLDELTKDYKKDGIDEKLSKEQKEDTLYNSYKLINQALKISNIPQQITDKITLLQNDVLGTKRYQTELLKQLQENNLNQISINSEGKRYYTNLHNYLVEYFELLLGLEIRIGELKYLDDGFGAKYHITISSDGMAQWYQFYKDYAKDRYKSTALHSVFFSYLYNTVGIQAKFYKKIFKTSNLQNNILSINTLPLAA